jgi:hypothetical protein
MIMLRHGVRRPLPDFPRPTILRPAPEAWSKQDPNKSRLAFSAVAAERSGLFLRVALSLVAAPSVRPSGASTRQRQGHAVRAGAALAADTKPENEIGKWTNAFLCAFSVSSATRLVALCPAPPVWRAKHRKPSGNKRPTSTPIQCAAVQRGAPKIWSWLQTSCGSGPVSPLMASRTILSSARARGGHRRTTGGEEISRANAGQNGALDTAQRLPADSAVLPTGGPTSESRV